MIGVAAGLATTGKVPFASSFAMFAAGRASERYPHYTDVLLHLLLQRFRHVLHQSLHSGVDIQQSFLPAQMHVRIVLSIVVLLSLI